MAKTKVLGHGTVCFQQTPDWPDQVSQSSQKTKGFLMLDSSPRTLTRRTSSGEVRKHKLKDGKSRWHHIKNKKEIYIFIEKTILPIKG